MTGLLPDLSPLDLETDPKACCAQLYESDAVLWLLDGELHPGRGATERCGSQSWPASRRASASLDVACGSGATALLLARELGCEVGRRRPRRACDRAAAMQPARPASGERASFLVGDAETLPLRDAGFDVALSECSLCTFPDKPSAIAEMARVVRPGGTIAIADVTADLDALPAALRTAAAHVACVADARSADEYVTLLRDAGCEPRAIEPHDAELRAMADRVEARLRVARMLTPPGEQRERAREAAALARMAIEAIARGSLGYALITARVCIHTSTCAGCRPGNEWRGSPKRQSEAETPAGRIALWCRSRVHAIVSDDIRLADLLAGLSLISDHGLGLPPDDAVRSCLVATALARKLDLGEAEVAAVFYDSLFEHIGCLGYAHESHLVWGDDVAANRAAQRTNFAAPKELFTAYLPSLLGDIEGWDRAQVAARLLTKGPGFLKRFATASCEVAAHTARRLGLPQDVQLGLRHYAEWWNGKGVPAGVKGDEITLTSRVVHVASVAAKFDVLGGPDLAVEAVQRRAGTIFDPAIAATFVQHARDLLEAAALGDPRRRVLEAEPEPLRIVPLARLPDVAAAFGDLADLKTPFTHGHSAGVARLARAAGECVGLDTETVARLEVAALLHDLGRVAISNAIWEKPGPLTSGEWEQVRLHPYHSERILSCTAALEPMAALAGMHHERMDASGYHRGSAQRRSRSGARACGGGRLAGDDASPSAPRPADD